MGLNGERRDAAGLPQVGHRGSASDPSASAGA
nr:MULTISPECIES: hypothetical protein [unclassified Streptomyces]